MTARRDAPASIGPRLLQGARPLLFERLVDEGRRDPHEPAPMPDRLLDRDGLLGSIARELGQLFNTRAPIDADALDARARSAIDYGIPDLSLYTPHDPASIARLARHLGAAIATYEPRLADPRIEIVPHPERAGQMLARITGALRLGHIMETVAFRFSLGAGDA